MSAYLAVLPVLIALALILPGIAACAIAADALEERLHQWLISRGRRA